ncbi:hypothetical protein [Streptomyces sp. NPDC002463]|uniref:hypothetical protein n=1 Tax=Streptomyces sp. NPDC002463 TaxID=3364645 RepID=UPI00367ED34A
MSERSWGAGPAFRQVLAAHLNVSTNHAQMVNVVMVNGTRMRGSHISLGPITIHRPGTTAGVLGLAVSLIVVAALLVYGMARLVGNAPGSDEGKGNRVRALSAAEAERMLPGLTDLPGKWQTQQPAHLTEDVAKCHNALAEYRSQEQDASGPRDLTIRSHAGETRAQPAPTRSTTRRWRTRNCIAFLGIAVYLCCYKRRVRLTT